MLNASQLTIAEGSREWVGERLQMSPDGALLPLYEGPRVTPNGARAPEGRWSFQSRTTPVSLSPLAGHVACCKSTFDAQGHPARPASVHNSSARSPPSTRTFRTELQPAILAWGNAKLPPDSTSSPRILEDRHLRSHSLVRRSGHNGKYSARTSDATGRHVNLLPRQLNSD